MIQVLEHMGTLAGAGVVSPAGWGIAAFSDSLAKGEGLPESRVTHDGVDGFARARRVPVQPKELRVKSPRLRRVSPVTKYLVAAVKEATETAGYAPGVPLGERVGLVVAFMNGCVNYTNRFYGEVRADPALASPILFPETVFNAPASHVATVLATGGPVATHLGDSAALGEALRTAALWNASGETDACIVACAEETDWLSAEGLAYYGKRLIACEGAVAFVLSPPGKGVQIERFTQAAYTDDAERAAVLERFGDPGGAVRQVFGSGMGVAAGFDLAECWLRGGGQAVFSGTNASAYKLELGRGEG